MNQQALDEIRISNHYMARYDGTSFDQNMLESQELAYALLGLKRMVEIASLTLSTELGSSSDNPVRLYIEGLEPGSFNFGLFLKKYVEPYPVSYMILLATIGGTYMLLKDIGLLNAQNASTLPPNTPLKVVELCQNEEYIRSLQKTVAVLKNDDEVFMVNDASHEEIFSVSGSDKSQFFIEAEDIGVDQCSTERGQITSVDTAARRNQVGFKINGVGSKIDSTLGENLSTDDFVDFLKDPFHRVEIEGIMTRSSISNEPKHFLIESFRVLESQSSLMD